MFSLRRSAAGLAMFSAVAVVPVIGTSTASAASGPSCRPQIPVVTYDPMYMGQSPYHMTAQDIALNGPNCAASDLQASVHNVQVRLGGIPADGVFGPATRARVIAFQRAHGLTPDGVVGDKTLHALNLEFLEA